MNMLIGIYELQLNRIDKELAELFEEYEPTLMNSVGGYKPAYTRVVPMNSRNKRLFQQNTQKMITV